MRYCRVRAPIDPETTSPLVALLTGGPGVESARILEWNLAGAATPTLLYAVEGDPDRFRTAARSIDAVASVVVSGTDEDPFFALVEADPDALDCITRGVARGGLVVRMPVEYHADAIQGRIVGDPATLQAIFEATDSGEATVEQLGTYPDAADRPTRTLSARQREAITVAHRIGYYDQPRQATQADVADDLGCTPGTAGRHLRAAEAKLVTAALDVFDETLADRS